MKQNRYWLNGGLGLVATWLALELFMGFAYEGIANLFSIKILLGIFRWTFIGNVIILFVFGSVVGWIYGKTTRKRSVTEQ